MLLLRAAVGITLVIYGGAYFVDGNNPTFGMLAFGLVAVANGAFLLVGFGTPVAAILACLGGVGIALSWFPTPTPNVLAARLIGVFVVIIATAIAFLGPGAVSLDARLFGRREIIIPPASRASKS